MIGTLLNDRYRLEEQIGRGGMAAAPSATSRSSAAVQSSTEPSTRMAPASAWSQRPSLRDASTARPAARASMAGRLDAVRWAKNEVFVGMEATLGDGDVIALIPPVAGG